MKKSFLLLTLLTVFVVGGCGTQTSNLQHDSRQGGYFKGGIDDSDAVRGPMFNDYEACKNRALGIQSKAAYGYAWCSKNCHDTVAGIPQCEDVVRTWRPIPTAKVFEGMTEEQLGPSRVCQEPKNTFGIGTDMYKGYQYAENGGDCENLKDDDVKLGCSYYFLDILTYLGCENQCNGEVGSDEYLSCALAGLSEYMQY